MIGKRRKNGYQSFRMKTLHKQDGIPTMKHTLASLRCLVVWLTAGGLLLGCSEQANQEPIRLGINPWPGYEFLYLAQEKGFYKELGVNVKIVEYSSLSDVRRGYERGNLDAMASTLIEVLQVRNNSARDPRVFLLADFSNGADVIIAKDPLTSVGELKGKRVAADTTSLPIFVLARALTKHNLTLQDITLVPMEQTDMAGQFNSGKLDAVVTYPPLSVELSRNPKNNTLFSSQEIPGEILDVISAEASLLKTRKADFEKIRTAWDKALDYAAKHPEEAYAIMGKREGISGDEFASALESIKILALKDQTQYLAHLPQTIHDVQNVLIDMNLLPHAERSDCCIADPLEH